MGEALGKMSEAGIDRKDCVYQWKETELYLTSLGVELGTAAICTACVDAGTVSTVLGVCGLGTSIAARLIPVFMKHFCSEELKAAEAKAAQAAKKEVALKELEA